MNELMKALDELFNSKDVEVEDGYFKSGEIVDRAEELCCEQLITQYIPLSCLNIHKNVN